MRAHEERLLPNVLRAAFPVEAGPHGVASNPAPTYGTPLHSRRSPSKPVGTALGALDTPGPNPVSQRGADRREVTIGAGRYFPGQLFDWSEKTLNDPHQDFAMLRPSVSASGVRTSFSAWRTVSRGGSQGKAMARAVLTQDSRPGGQASAVPPPRSRSRQMRQTLADSLQRSQQACAERSRSRAAPFKVQLGRFGEGSRRSACISDRNMFRTRPFPPAAGAEGQPPHPRTVGRRWAGAETREEEAINAQAARATLVSDCSAHLCSTAQSLRTYNVNDVAHRPPTAISTIATTFARAPKPLHILDATLAAPSERIAANYSLGAWGLSARTLRFLSDVGAVAHRATGLVGGQLPECCLPDKDGIAAEAQMHMAFMPLELFDNPEFESRSPQEWVALGADSGGTPGQVAWLSIETGGFEQRSVRVLDYNEVQQVFRVRYDYNGAEKNVKRLNLCFDAEDPAMLEERRAAAHRCRSAHEEVLRWRFYLDTHVAEEVIDTYDFAAKTDAVLATCVGVSDAVFQGLKHSLVEDFHMDYCLAVRIANLEYHRRNPGMEAKLRVLRLPPRRLALAAPERGVISVVPAGATPAASFTALQAEMVGMPLLAEPVVHNVLQVCPEEPLP